MKNKESVSCKILWKFSGPKGRKIKGKCMVLVDAQWREIPYTYMTGKSLQINIAIDSYSKLYSAK